MNITSEAKAALASESEEGWLLWKYGEQPMSEDHVGSVAATPALKQLTLIGTSYIKKLFWFYCFYSFSRHEELVRKKKPPTSIPHCPREFPCRPLKQMTID
jgi:hypothetical protein